jgi:hypothetical protein
VQISNGIRLYEPTTTVGVDVSYLFSSSDARVTARRPERNGGRAEAEGNSRRCIAAPPSYGQPWSAVQADCWACRLKLDMLSAHENDAFVLPRSRIGHRLA